MIKMLPGTLIVILLCLINPLESWPTINSVFSTTTTTTTSRPSIDKLSRNISNYLNGDNYNNPDNQFALLKDNQVGKLNLVNDKRTQVNNQLQTGKVNYNQQEQQLKDVSNQVNNNLRSSYLAINGNTNQRQQRLGHLNVIGLQGDLQSQLLPVSSDSKSQSAKYREVEEIIPTNEVDQESREPEISRDPKTPRGGGGGPVIPPHEPESAPIDPNTPGYAGPPPPTPGQSPPDGSSFPVPPSTGPQFPGGGGFPSTPYSPPQSPSFPPNSFPTQQPGVIVPPSTPTETDTEGQRPQPPSVSPYYPSPPPPATFVPNGSPFYPETFNLSPPQQHEPIQPPTVQFPLQPVASPFQPPPPPPPPPSTSVYSSYSPPSWLTNFYPNYYSNFPYNEGLVATYPTHLSPTLKSTASYLISRSVIPIGSSQLTAVTPYLTSPTTHTHLNPLYLTQHDQQTHLIADNNQEPQLLNVNPVVNHHSPASNDKESRESSITNPIQTTTTESSIEGLKESEIDDDAERISNL
ncbi:mucin-2-like [Panonychus citri]|uniref:mucin-2-like n=1 Tax=Panonychus citri TaxID=50023 RepID=UPI002306EC2B|nr:mucin-2-like [Panonychus citri]